VIVSVQERKKHCTCAVWSVVNSGDIVEEALTVFVDNKLGSEKARKR
jgi:hypothetical protein